MTRLKDQKFEVTCPGCGKARMVCYPVMTTIRNGKASGYCRSCSGALTSRHGIPVVTPLGISLRKTRFHRIWQNMWNRCTDPDADNWEWYGGRGITVCDRWKSFDAFAADMHPSYEEGLTIDRIDTNGPYSAGNCRWIPFAEQAVNRSSNRNVTFQGRTQTISQWAAELGISYFTLRMRLDRGWPVEEALSATVLTVTESARRGGRKAADMGVSGRRKSAVPGPAATGRP